MKTCKTCKWWGKTDLNDCEDEEELTDDFVPMRDCKSPKIQYLDDSVGDHRLKDGEARYWDFEAYSAGFATTPSFGCSCWEKKD